MLFGQDVHGSLHDDFGSDADAYQQSLLQMIDLGADILCEGHFVYAMLGPTQREME